eukprot:scaffold11680_cov142-Cylindrotheca_fusiformis.AAC.2
MEDALVAGETRIRDVDGFCGTVVYVGPVASAKNPDEIYAGIRWDDPSRGKHDGSVICRRTNALVRHFSCGATQGSFLRLHKVDTGIALTSALLRSKYVDMDAPVVAPNNLLPHTARTSSGRAKPIEFVGEMMIRGRQQLEDIDTISLRREGISKASDEDLQADFGNIRNIDIAGNLLSNWPEVLKIMNQFPLLNNFNVAYNRIGDIDVPLEHFDHIMVLNLNSCSIGTKTMQWLGQSMPNLEALCIANANLSDLESYDVGGFDNLKSLDCSSCQLSSWEKQVGKFAIFPKLEQLSLDENPLVSIPTTTDRSSYFPSLLSLQIAGTAVQSWTDLEGINQLLTTIKSLRLKNTPLTSSMGQGETRFLAIARFPSLEYFNGSVIAKHEKQEAERRYVSLVANLLSRMEEEGAKEKLVSEHPNYLVLLEKHKNMVISTAKNQNGAGTNLASSVCNVTIRSLAVSSCDMEPIIRRLPDSLPVGRLKALCGRAFGLDVDLMTLHFRVERDAFPAELDNDDNTLNYYGVCDGAEILMNEVDAEARELEARRLKEEQERKIVEQENEVTAMQELQKKNKS